MPAVRFEIEEEQRGAAVVRRRRGCGGTAGSAGVRGGASAKVAMAMAMAMGSSAAAVVSDVFVLFVVAFFLVRASPMVV
uniref:Predicted protein n=1 Tax=Hordeum vulgare subsp. vulgare TaxID=112509 RepID=F2DGR2_HORVV|nr:predicted protein [Hordeum vulgare subsp. vulgare]